MVFLLDRFLFETFSNENLSKGQSIFSYLLYLVAVTAAKKNEAFLSTLLSMSSINLLEHLYALITLMPVIVSLKWLYIGDRNTDSVLLTWRAVGK